METPRTRFRRDDQTPSSPTPESDVRPVARADADTSFVDDHEALTHRVNEGDMGRVRGGGSSETRIMSYRGPSLPADTFAFWDDALEIARNELVKDSERTRRSRDAYKDPHVFDEFAARAMSAHSQRFQVPEHLAADLRTHLYNEMMGLGAMTAYLAIPGVTDIMLDAYDTMDIVRDGVKYRMDRTPFADDGAVFAWLQTMVFNPVNRDFDASHPLENAQLSDGSRLFAFTWPVSAHTGFAIRKHRKEVFMRTEDYEATGVAPPAFFEDLKSWVLGKRTMMISGSTGSGKTTLTNYALGLVPYTERILTLEDTPELQPQHPRVKAMYTQQHGSRVAESKSSDIDMRNLLRAGLRMNPDRIVIGEVRDAETFDLLDTLNTGHAGSFSTLHANSAVDAITRLQTMAIRAAVDFPLDALRDQIASVVDLVVQITYDEKAGNRLITGVEQVCYHPHYARHPQALEDGYHLYTNLTLRTLWARNADGVLERVAQYVPPDHG